MMNELGQISATIPNTAPTAGAGNEAQTRRANLERARRTASANQVADAQQAQVRRDEQFRQSNEIVQRAIGANTRLEIAEGQGSNPFTYRAVDIDSGEVVNEWPPEQFSNLLNTLSQQVVDPSSQATGVVVDERA